MTGYIRAAAGFPFCYAHPWILVERNSGHQIGYITSATAGPDGEMLYKGRIWSEASGEYSRTERPIRRTSIRRFWRNPPGPDAVRRAKRAANKRLRAAEKAGHFGRALRP